MLSLVSKLRFFIILMTGEVLGDCVNKKTIRQGSLSGKYYLKEEDSKFCGDGCLYSKEDDPLSIAGEPFGYCMDFTFDCSCEDGCERPPEVGNGEFTDCVDKNGNPVEYAKSSTDVHLLEGTKCFLVCKDGYEQAYNVSSRFDEVLCKGSNWTDKNGESVPRRIDYMCIPKEPLCEPPWTWKSLENGKYTCDLSKSTNVKKNNEGLPIGLTEGTQCILNCDNAVIDQYIHEKSYAEINITCTKTSLNQVGWKDNNGKPLRLENLEDICDGCPKPPTVINGTYENCTVPDTGVIFPESTELYPNTTECQLKCIRVPFTSVSRMGDLDSGFSRIGDLDSAFSRIGDLDSAFSRIGGLAQTSRYNKIICSAPDWEDMHGDPVTDSILDICKNECLPLPAISIENGTYVCTINGKEVTDRFPVGTECRLECDPGTAKTLNSTKDLLTCARDGEDFQWIDLEGKIVNFNNIDQVCNHQCEKPQNISKVSWRCVGGSPDGSRFNLAAQCALECPTGETVLNETTSSISTGIIIECKLTGWKLYNNATKEYEEIDPIFFQEKCYTEVEVEMIFVSSASQPLNRILINKKRTADYMPGNSNTSNIRIFENTEAVNVTEFTDSDRIKFKTVPGSWFFMIQTEDRRHYEVYKIVKVHQPMKIEIILEPRYKLTALVLNENDRSKIDGSSVSLRILEDEAFKTRKMKNKDSTCTAMMFDKCMIENQLKYQLCRFDIKPDYNLCMEASKSGIQPGFDLYMTEWNFQDGETGLTGFLPGAQTYEGTAVPPDNVFQSLTKEFLLKDPEQTEEFLLGHSPLFAVPNVTDETGLKIKRFTLVIIPPDAGEVVVTTPGSVDYFPEVSTKPPTRFPEGSMVIEVTDPSEPQTVPRGNLTVCVEGRNFDTACKDVSVFKNTTINITVRRHLKFNLKLIDSLGGEDVKKSTVNFVLLRDKSKTIPTKQAVDSKTDFKSKIYDKNTIFDGKSTATVSDDCLYEERSPRGKLNNEDHINGRAYAGKWALQFYTTDEDTGGFTKGYFINDVYNAKNYMQDVYFFDMHRTALAGNKSMERLVDRQLVLSTAVYDDDCFNLCKDYACPKRDCQSLPLGSNQISIEVQCRGCTADQLQHMKTMVSPRSTQVTEGVATKTVMRKTVALTGEWSIKCSKVGNNAGDYVAAPTHFRKITENTYLPCLLHKKMEKTKLQGMDVDFIPMVKVALGWDKPRIEVGGDFTLNAVVFDSKNGSLFCGTSLINKMESPCFGVIEPTKTDGKKEYLMKIPSTVTVQNHYLCESRRVVIPMRDRCCKKERSDIQCKDDKWNRGLGLDTLVVGKNLFDYTTQPVILIYAIEAFIPHEKNVLFRSSNLELSIHYKDNAKEDVKLIKPKEKYFNDDTSGNNVMFLKCLNFEDGKLKMTDPANIWLHYDNYGEMDLSHVFGHDEDKGLRDICNNCMELFCPMKEGNEIKRSLEDMQRCCCCADTLELKMGNPNTKFTCPYRGKVGKYEEKCKKWLEESTSEDYWESEKDFVMPDDDNSSVQRSSDFAEVQILKPQNETGTRHIINRTVHRENTYEDALASNLGEEMEGIGNRKASDAGEVSLDKESTNENLNDTKISAPKSQDKEDDVLANGLSLGEPSEDVAEIEAGQDYSESEYDIELDDIEGKDIESDEEEKFKPMSFIESTKREDNQGATLENNKGRTSPEVMKKPDSEIIEEREDSSKNVSGGGIKEIKSLERTFDMDPVAVQSTNVTKEKNNLSTSPERERTFERDRIVLNLQQPEPKPTSVEQEESDIFYKQSISKNSNRLPMAKAGLLDTVKEKQESKEKERLILSDNEDMIKSNNEPIPAFVKDTDNVKRTMTNVDQNEMLDYDEFANLKFDPKTVDSERNTQLLNDQTNHNLDQMIREKVDDFKRKLENRDNRLPLPIPHQEFDVKSVGDRDIINNIVARKNDHNLEQQISAKLNAKHSSVSNDDEKLDKDLTKSMKVLGKPKKQSSSILNRINDENAMDDIRHEELREQIVDNQDEIPSNQKIIKDKLRTRMANLSTPDKTTFNENEIPQKLVRIAKTSPTQKQEQEMRLHLKDQILQNNNVVEN